MRKFAFTILFLLLALFIKAQENAVNPNGYNSFYFANGKLSSEGTMRDGKPDGYWKTYWENGTLKAEGNRKNFELDSTWTFYDENGKTTLQINYLNGKKKEFAVPSVKMK